MSASTNFGLEMAGSPAWKHELNERLAEARARRTREKVEQATLPTLGSEAKGTPRAILAAKVAARYAKAPSYSEILAAEARSAAKAAEAAANAAREACAAAQALLHGLAPQPALAPPPVEDQPAHWEMPALDQKLPVEDCASVRSHPETEIAPLATAMEVAEAEPEWPSPSPSLSTSTEITPLPVNLIEFPRELIAARRMRPRLEEGPLRETPEQAAIHDPQLRIFEVEPESVSMTVDVEPAAREWSPICLDLKPASTLPGELTEPMTSSIAAPAGIQEDIPIQAAPLEDRAMAWIVDSVLVSIAFLAFIFVFASSTAQMPSGKSALVAGALVAAGFFLLYQFLFFRFTDSTPGMRYAKIELATLENEKPARKAMRRRILYLLLSTAPLGLGFLWAWFDADRLSWHDRISHMYQRSYN